MKEQQTTTVFGVLRSAILALLVGTLIFGPSMALAATNTANFGIAVTPVTPSNTLTLTSVDTTVLDLYKRAFLTDGTPIADSSTLPIGTTVKFLLYVDNFTGSPVSDLNISDTLAGFTYTAGTIKMLSNLPGCTANDGTCTTVEEATMFSTLDDVLLLPLNDDVSTAIDAAGFGTPALTITAGRTAGNQQLDMLLDQTWGLLFTTTIQ